MACLFSIQRKVNLLLVSSYLIGSLWVAMIVGWRLFTKFDDHRHIPFRAKMIADACAQTLGFFTVLLIFLWIGACIGHGHESFEHREHVRENQRKLARQQFESTYTNVFELLRERNRRELELRLDYDLRAAKMIEAIHSNSFSVVYSDLTNLPSSFLDLALIMKLRSDIGLIKRELKSEEDFPSESFELLDGGTGQFQTDDSP